MGIKAWRPSNANVAGRTREREELSQPRHSNMSDKLNRRDVTSVRASFLEEGMTLLELETLKNTRK